MRRYHPKLPWHSLGTHSRATPRTLSATPRTRTRLATHSHSLGHATHSHSHHLLQQPKGSLTLPALLTCTGVFTEARNIRCQQLVHHLLRTSRLAAALPQRVPATSSSRGAGAAGAVGNQGCAVIKGVGCPPPAAPGALEPLGRSGESGARVRRRHPARPGRPNAYARGGHQGCWVPATRSSRGAGAAGAVGRKWGPLTACPSHMH